MYPLTFLPVPAKLATNFATDSICALVYVEPNAGIPPPPLVTCFTTAA